LGGQRHRFRRRTDGHRVHSLASCPQPCPASGCISGPLPSATHGEASRNSSWLLKTSCSVPMLQERACPLPQQLAQRLLQGPHSLRGLAGCLGGQVHHTSLHHSPPRGHSSRKRGGFSRQGPDPRSPSREPADHRAAASRDPPCRGFKSIRGDSQPLLPSSAVQTSTGGCTPGSQCPPPLPRVPDLHWGIHVKNSLIKNTVTSVPPPCGY
jgi:hypothetical protein